MTDERDILDKVLAQAMELEKRREELKKKELYLREKKVELDTEKYAKSEKELKIISETSFGKMDAGQLASVQAESEEYIEAARHGMEFITKSFDQIVPFFRKNLITVGGKTGEGKSTAVSNIILSTINQINPLTGKKRRILVITNEEAKADVFNRVTCLSMGWHYTNHSQFSEEQKKTFSKSMPYLNELMTVIDNTHGGSFGVTTTVEGIKGIFDKLIADKEFYDVVVIDYYQNIRSSKLNPYMKDWEAQAALVNVLDNYKNIYPAPIVIMAQVQPPNEENKIPFELRLKGSKSLIIPSTLVMEMIANRENLTTEWIIHKSRFTEAVGKSFLTGYHRGRFVEYDVPFMTQVNKDKEKRLADAVDKAGRKPDVLKEIFDKHKKEG